MRSHLVSTRLRKSISAAGVVLMKIKALKEIIGREVRSPLVVIISLGKYSEIRRTTQWRRAALRRMVRKARESNRSKY
jgi:hypothetical protein